MEKCISAKALCTTDKKPKDLLRAIGKIESNDWNIRQIEKKIEQSKKTEVGKSREKVPKWSKEQFLQRQTKISRPTTDQECSNDRFKDIDQTIKTLDKQLKEGSIRDLGERGKNKVASIAGNFIKQDRELSEGDKSAIKSVKLNRNRYILDVVLKRQLIKIFSKWYGKKQFLIEIAVL